MGVRSRQPSLFCQQQHGQKVHRAPTTNPSLLLSRGIVNFIEGMFVAKPRLLFLDRQRGAKPRSIFIHGDFSLPLLGAPLRSALPFPSPASFVCAHIWERSEWVLSQCAGAGPTSTVSMFAIQTPLLLHSPPLFFPFKCEPN